SLRVAGLQVRLQYFGELRKWADEAAGALSAAVHLCDLEPKHCPAAEAFRRRHAGLAQLSALIDRGRWFSPNTDHAAAGQPGEGRVLLDKAIGQLTQLVNGSDDRGQDK